MCFLNYIKLLKEYHGYKVTQQYINTLKTTLFLACTERKYYMVHLIVKLFKAQIKNKTASSHLYSFDLYIAHYLLNHKLVNFLLSNYKVYLNDFLMHWLLCCHDPDKSRYIGKLDLSRSKCSIADLSSRIGLFCNLGADIDEDTWWGLTLLKRSAKELNINIFRALIINNCSLDKDTLEPVGEILLDKILQVYDFNPRTYTFLKIVLLSGADFHPYTLREIQFYLEYRLEKYGFENDDMKWIQAWFHEPLSLCFFCRKAIRNKFGKQLTRVLRDLEYPQSLKDYIRTIVL